VAAPTPRRPVISWDSGTITERSYLEAFCEKQGLPFIEIDANLVDRALLAKANLKYLARIRVLPLSIQDGRLNVAMEKPAAQSVLADLQRIFGVAVNSWLGEPSRMTAGPRRARGRGHRQDRPLDVGGAVPHRRAGHRRAAQRVRNPRHHHPARHPPGRQRHHIDPDRTRMRVRFRVDGELVRVAEYPTAQVTGMISRLKVLAKADIAERRAHQQGRIFVRTDGEEVDIRASFYVTVHGENAVLRLLRKTSVRVGLQDMGFSRDAYRSFVHDVLEPSSGMLLVTGPTGSGKTTTLYAAVSQLVDDTRKIITCEDPVEYLVDGVTQCSIMDRPGVDLRRLAAVDPAAGSRRDPCGRGARPRVGRHGHPLRAHRSQGADDAAHGRFAERRSRGCCRWRSSRSWSGPPSVGGARAAAAAPAVLALQDGATRRRRAKARAMGTTLEELAPYHFVKGKGCPSCHYTGYRGRVGAYELLVMNDALRDAVIQRKSPYELRKIAQEMPGFYSTQEDGLAKALRGLTTLSEVIANCPRVPLNRRLRQLQEIYA
jgi:type IV pilus assembly protein PilB